MAKFLVKFNDEIEVEAEDEASAEFIACQELMAEEIKNLDELEEQIDGE